MFKTGELYQAAESLARPSIRRTVEQAFPHRNRLELLTGAIQGHPAKKGRGRQKRRPNWDSRNYRPGSPTRYPYWLIRSAMTEFDGDKGLVCSSKEYEADGRFAVPFLLAWPA